jgi:hypothetical protein
VMMFEVDSTEVSANIVGAFYWFYFNRDLFFSLIVDCLVDRPSSIILE